MSMTVLHNAGCPECARLRSTGGADNRGVRNATG